MDDKKYTSPADDEKWLEELFANIGSTDAETPVPKKADTDTRKLSDLEFERIMAETLSEKWTSEAVEETPAPVQDKEYRDAFATDIPERPVRKAAPQEDPEEPTEPVRKVRPKRKKGYGMFGIPHLISTGIWLALCITIGISLARFIWVCATDVLAFGKENRIIYVTITDTDDMDSITDKLYNAGLIEYPNLFKLYASITEARDSITSGTYELNSLFDYHALVNGMSASSTYRESIEVVIPEGYTCAQIFALLEEKGVCTVAELEAYSMESDFSSYWFLEDAKKGKKNTLEGFLFPDTYEFYTNATPKHVFQKMLARFDEQFNDELKGYIDTLNQKLATMYARNGYGKDYINEHKVGMYDIITIASMIEKESANSGENYEISSVIYNRLTNRRAFPYLQIDATIVYALGGKSNLTDADLQLDSPYNTRKYPGLPPTPIANPGLSSILSALSPADTGYYYYALDPAQGKHHFSKTYQEHQNFLNSLN